MKDLVKNLQIYKFCTYGFLKNLRFYEPFLMVFLVSRLPDNYSQIGILYSLRFLIRFILEIPSGIIADVLGRKHSLVFSFVVYILSFLGYYLADNFIQLLIPTLLFGIADAFRTGSHKAMILEYLKKMSWLNLRTEYYGLTRSVSQLGSAFSSIVVFFIYLLKPEYDFIFLITCVPYLLGLINLLSYPNYLNGIPTSNKSLRLNSLKEKTSEALKQIGSKTQVKKLLGCSMFFGFHHALKDYLQIIVIGLGIAHHFDKSSYQFTDATLLPLFYIILYLITSFSSSRASYLIKFFNSPENTINKLLLLGIAFSMAAGFFLLFNITLASIILLIGVFMLLNFQRPFVVNYISANFQEGNMATTLSIESQLGSLIASVVALIMGVIADITSVGHAIIAASALVYIGSQVTLLKIK